MIIAEVGTQEITRKNIKNIPGKPYLSAYKVHWCTTHQSKFWRNKFFLYLIALPTIPKLDLSWQIHHRPRSTKFIVSIYDVIIRKEVKIHNTLKPNLITVWTHHYLLTPQPTYYSHQWLSVKRMQGHSEKLFYRNDISNLITLANNTNGWLTIQVSTPPSY